MKNILIIGFGGTIAMTPDSTRGGVLRPAKTIDEILTLVPTLRGHANITLKQILNIDSTNVNPSHWAMLAIAIADSISGYDAIIVTHGTDTMAYTATAISFAIGSNPPIPIIFTGSQLPLVEFGTDARFNLENAVKTAIHASEMGVNEVMIVFNDRVLRAVGRSNQVKQDSPHSNRQRFLILLKSPQWGLDSIRRLERKRLTGKLI